MQSCRAWACVGGGACSWLLIAFYLVSPKLAYNFMQRVEHHAADTYSECAAAFSTRPAGGSACGSRGPKDIKRVRHAWVAARARATRRPGGWFEPE